MALLIRTDGAVEPLPEHPLSLADLQRLVGGYIELVPLPEALTAALTAALDPPVSGRVVLVCDEEGQLKEKPVNHVASVLAGQVVVGDVVQCLVTDPGEETEAWT